MSVNGMKIWLEQSGIEARLFEEDASGKNLVLKEEHARYREQCIRLLEAGKPQLLVLTEYGKGSADRALLLAMVLVEDMGVSVSLVHPQFKRMYGEVVSGYLIRTGDGGRALPKREPKASVAVRTHELAKTR